LHFSSPASRSPRGHGARATGRRQWQAPASWPHALLHLALIAGGHSHHVAFDLLAVVLPSAIALYSAFPSQGEHHA